LAYRERHSEICQGALPNVPLPADFGGVIFCAGCDMPMVAQTIARSAKNRQWIRCRSLFCVNQWEEEKYFILFRYWLNSKGTLPMSF
jgi:hypothetical protein